MRTFEHFNPAAGAVCPVCGTSNDQETVLIPIAETQEGNLCQAIQAHTACIESRWVYLPSFSLVVINCARQKAPAT